MVLSVNFGNQHPEKFSRNLRRISVAEFHHSQSIFSVVHRNFTYDSETYDFMKLYFELYLRFFGLFSIQIVHDVF